MNHQGSVERKRRLKKLSDLTRHNYGGGGAWYNEEKKRYIRYYRGSRSKYLKKLGNRRVRRDRTRVLNNGEYRKVFDFWWELY